MSSIEDLATPARIRLAAVTLIGRQGAAHTTVRQVAARAGVSPGLVMHHFGSKEGLVTACDDWVVASLEQERTLLALDGRMPGLQDYLAEHPEFAALIDYLVTAVRAGGEVAERVWERLFAMTLGSLDEGVAQGAMRPPEDREAAAAMMLAQSLGVMVLGRQVSRSLGGSSLEEPAVADRYGRATLELYSRPLFTPAYADLLRTSFLPGGTARPGQAAQADPASEAAQPDGRARHGHDAQEES